MKKTLLTVFLLLGLLPAQAQFFQGWGIMAGGTLGRQNWYYHEPASKERLKYLLRYNGEIFAEFGNHPTFRWVTELQYNNKGAKWKTSDINGNSMTVRFQNHYAAWNNYLMIRKELFAIIPYVKIGPRAEYVVATDQSFNRFHLTASAGGGVEFVAFGRIKFLTEFHWVPDLTESANDEFYDVKQHAWELRVGIKIARKGSTTCPAYRDGDQQQM
ncbi:MAG TPA: hypothetical protein VI731_11330 [Bacteroidia bacterium]|nr:hypothetical protein [Bacteroidia bacterium]